MKDATKIFKRHEGGPLLQVKDFPGKAQIYNPAPVQCGDETILLVSVVEHAAMKGFGRDVGQTRVARSKDGINFELSDSLVRGLKIKRLMSVHVLSYGRDHGFDVV